ncbi:MAG: SpoIIE family protein phosphatase [Pirellulales bacterium]
MSRPIPDYLRLYSELNPPASPAAEPFAGLDLLCRAFERATGWPLRYAPPDDAAGQRPDGHFEPMWSAPVDPGVGIPAGLLRIESCTALSAEHGPRIELNLAGELAGSVTELLVELARTQHALWQREAELAAGVPLVPHREEQRQLAQRLENVLKGGAEAIGCQAAGLYLLDTDTTYLKLRSSWGLPLERLTAPPRTLRDAAADLEALLGHAVVLDDTSRYQEWNLPEDFAAAVCVPVSSPTVPLGTLWLFSGKPRAFSDQEVNIAEVVAGRLAADLEREMLLAEGIDAARVKRQLAAAERLQNNQLPKIAPLVEGWQIAGWTAQAGGLGGDFYDWFVRDDDSLALAVGDCLARGVEAALSACTLRAALRAHGEYLKDPGDLVERINRTLWASSAGDQAASLFFAALDPFQGAIRYTAAGHAGAILLRSAADAAPVNLPTAATLALGLGPETRYATGTCQLSAGEALLVTSEGVRSTWDEQGRSLGEEQLAAALVPHLDSSAETLVELARDLLESRASQPARQDRTVLVLKRRA